MPRRYKATSKSGGVRDRPQRGVLELDFVKGRLGRMPAPAWAFDMLGRLVASLILLGDDYAEISHLTVTEGRLAFEATAGLN